jgi:hypothetical protein
MGQTVNLFGMIMGYSNWQIGSSGNTSDLYSVGTRFESLFWSLEINYALFHCTSIISPVCDECRISGQHLVCYVEIHADDPQYKSSVLFSYFKNAYNSNIWNLCLFPNDIIEFKCGLLLFVNILDNSWAETWTFHKQHRRMLLLIRCPHFTVDCNKIHLHAFIAQYLSTLLILLCTK